MARRRKSLFTTRRSNKIAPGMRVTLTKKGLGLSVKTPLGTYSTRTGKITRKKPRKRGGYGQMLLILTLAGLDLFLAGGSRTAKTARNHDPKQSTTLVRGSSAEASMRC